MSNLFKRLKSMLPDPPLLVGEVVLLTDYGARIQFPDGSSAIVRGSATVGQNVFVRDGVIEGPAPALPAVVIEV